MEGSNKRNGFEAEWASAFEGAEAQPSPQVWKNIVGELANQQLGAYRKKALFYQMLAAASVLFAVGIAALYFFVGDTNQVPTASNEGQANQEQVADLPALTADEELANIQDEEKGNNEITNNQTQKDLPNNATLAASEKINNGKKPGSKPSTKLDNDPLLADNAKTTQPINGTIGGENKDGKLETTNQKAIDADNPIGLGGDKDERQVALIALADGPEKEANITTKANDKDESAALAASNDQIKKLDAQNQQVSFLDYLDSKYAPVDFKLTAKALPEFFYKVPLYNVQEVKIEKIEENKLWAGVNFGSGTFDPNFGAPSAVNFSAMSAREQLIAAVVNPDGDVRPLVEKTNSGVSYTIGFEVGKKVAPRWILQTGLQYGVYGSGATTNQVYSDGSPTDPTTINLPVSFQNQMALYSQQALILNNDNIEVDNKFQLLAVPVKVGYILLDKKLNIILNAGISGDFYLGNTLSTASVGVSDYSFSPGSESPYRRVHLTAITGIQLGYRIGNNYYLSVEPNYRHSLTEFTKSGLPYSSLPSRTGIAFGFRYNF